MGLGSEALNVILPSTISTCKLLTASIHAGTRRPLQTKPLCINSWGNWELTHKQWHIQTGRRHMPSPRYTASSLRVPETQHLFKTQDTTISLTQQSSRWAATPSLTLFTLFTSPEHVLLGLLGAVKDPQCGTCRCTSSFFSTVWSRVRKAALSRLGEAACVFRVNTISRGSPVLTHGTRGTLHSCYRGRTSILWPGFAPSTGASHHRIHMPWRPRWIPVPQWGLCSETGQERWFVLGSLLWGAAGGMQDIPSSSCWLL